MIKALTRIARSSIAVAVPALTGRTTPQDADSLPIVTRRTTPRAPVTTYTARPVRSPLALYRDIVSWSAALHGSSIGVMSPADIVVGLGLLRQATLSEPAVIHLARAVLRPSVVAWSQAGSHHGSAPTSWRNAEEATLALIECCFNDTRLDDWIFARLALLDALHPLPVAPPSWTVQPPCRWPDQAGTALRRHYGTLN